MRFGNYFISNGYLIFLFGNIIELIGLYKYGIFGRFNLYDPENQLKYDCRKIKKLQLTLSWVALFICAGGIAYDIRYRSVQTDLAADWIIFTASIIAASPWGRWLFKNKDFNEPQENE